MSGATILFLDPFSGLSGDMFVGALLDLGLDLARLSHELSKLNLSGYQLSAKKVFRGAIGATKFDVGIGGALQTNFDAEPGDAASAEHGHEHGHGAHDHGLEARATSRTFCEIKALIEASSLSGRVKTSSVAAFAKLAEAEGRVHAMAAEDVAFHEVGALDSIVDFVAVCAGLELLGIDEVWCAPVALGRGGFVNCQHGLMPVPAPATLELAKYFPLRDTPVEKELTTPTGAALIAALATRFVAVPEMAIEKIGYGAGSREKQTVPNVLRVALGQATGADERDSVVELCANIDDASGEALGDVFERLFAAGALDVFFTPIQMKKNRPATLLTVLCEPAKFEALAALLLTASGTFGVRYQTLQRLKLEREIRTVATRFGDVRVKIGRRRGTLCAAHPEFEDCRRLALEHGVPLHEVQRAAVQGIDTAS